MNVKSAAIQVLKEAGEPLHAREIAKKIHAEGLWESAGKTPDATVSARLYSDIKSKGEKSSFVKVGPQTFALRSSPEEPNNGGRSPAPVEKSSRPSWDDGALSFNDCAQKVLEQFGGKRPMHYKEITEKALEKGWLVTGGKTPEATMYAQVVTEIKRQRKRGENPRFVQHGRGYVGLSQWMGRGLAFQIEQHNQQVRKALRKRLLAMKPEEFEELVSQLLTEMGPEKFCKDWIAKQDRLLITDTTMRDAHQSLLATRMRSYDMLAIASAIARKTPDLFSLEMWGGATFEVAYRFLKEDPWQRLVRLRAKTPNIMFQM